MAAAGPTGRDSDVHSIDPLRLLSPRRIDLVCKYLYFRELAASRERGDVGRSPAEEMYAKHIDRRTGGVEPPDPFGAHRDHVHKRSVADYTSQAKTLLASLRSAGFDPAAAITYFSDGTLGNGAHRLSAALALNTPVFARTGHGEGTAWSFQWFVENGFTTEELQQLLYTYTQLKTADVVVFALYSPARMYWDEFCQTIAQRFYTVGQIDVSVDTPLAMYELVHDLYGTVEAVSDPSLINRKALLLAMAPLAVRVVVAERRATADDIYSIANLTKSECRERARGSVAAEVYLSAHASSSREETLNLAGVLLSPNNCRQLRRRVSAGVRVDFAQWLVECRRTCARVGIAIEDICVVGSSPLEVVGVRPSTDVDFTLKSDYRRARYGAGVTHLSAGVDIVTAGYHRSRNRAAITDDELIDNPDWHFRYRGFKFANPEIVLDQKDFYRREKDLRDLEMAGRKLEATQAVPFDPAFHFAVCTEALLRRAAGITPSSGAQAAPGLVRDVAQPRRPLVESLKGGVRRVRRRLAALMRRS
jgi:hypothetical protein